jgi:hypothetical protein
VSYGNTPCSDQLDTITARLPDLTPLSTGSYRISCHIGGYSRAPSPGSGRHRFDDVGGGCWLLRVTDLFGHSGC